MPLLGKHQELNAALAIAALMHARVKPLRLSVLEGVKPESEETEQTKKLDLLPIALDEQGIRTGIARTISVSYTHLSKSLDNGIDPLDVVSKYGTDALRISLVSGVAMGSDMRFYDEKVEGARNSVSYTHLDVYKRQEMEGHKARSAGSYWAKRTVFRRELLKATQTGIPANSLGIACRPSKVGIGLNGDPIERGYQGSSLSLIHI